MSGYSNFITAIVELTGGYNLVDATSAMPTDDPDFNAILPSAIQSAEGMMYRDPDLDFLQTRATDNTVTTFSGTRALAVPAKFLTIENLNLITPAGTTSPASGTRIPLSRVSEEWVNAVYPVEASVGTPVYGGTYYAMLTNTSAIVAPTPDGQYTAEIYGVVTQTPLSSANTDTILTNFYPDLFNAACMIYFSGFQKNFSAAGADSPPQAISWKSYYDGLKQGAAFMSARMKLLGAGASAFPPAPQAQTVR